MFPSEVRYQARDSMFFVVVGLKAFSRCWVRLYLFVILLKIRSGPMNMVLAVLVLFCVVGVCVVVFMFVPYLLVMVCRICFSWLVRVVGFCCCLFRRFVRYLFGVRVLLCVCPMHLLGYWYFFCVLFQMIWHA